MSNHRSIEITVTDNQRVVDLSVDVDFTVESGDSHISDVVKQLVLDKCKTHPTAVLKPGKHNIRMLCVVSSLEEAEKP